jgi:hypothetical protein
LHTRFNWSSFPEKIVIYHSNLIRYIDESLVVIDIIK